MSTRSQQLSLLDKLYGCWFGAVFGCCALFTAVLVCVVPGERNRRRAARGAARAAFRLSGCGPAVTGLRHLPEQPAIAVANHASYLDGPLLTAVLPANYQFVIKREVTRVPVMHFVLRRIGAHFVDRSSSAGGARDMRTIHRTALGGGSLAFFPEGTFRAEPGLRRFRHGAFVLAQRNALPLVPIAIQGTRDMLPAERLLPAPRRLTVTIHAPVQVASRDELETALAQCRDAILGSLDEPDLTTQPNR